MTPHGKRSDTLVHQREPYNAEPSQVALAQSSLTPVDTFYARCHGPMPQLEPTAWRLGLGGLVERELEWSLAELQDQFAHRELLATLQCAGNRRAGLIAARPIPKEAPWGPGATGTALWSGASLADLLMAAGYREEARYVEFLGADISPEAVPPQRFGGSITLRKALAGEVLLAWRMNGEPLAPVHGAPVRVVVPGYIGARSVKWLQQIVVRSSPSENFFQAHTYRLLPADADPDAGLAGAGLALGAVAVNADILTPASGTTVRAGRIEVIGYAFAGDDRHVVRVDISASAGRKWQQAELLDPPSRWAWTRWRARIAVEPGSAEIVARAWDSAAATQPEDPAQLWNPKGYANNSWARARIEVSG